MIKNPTIAKKRVYYNYYATALVIADKFLNEVKHFHNMKIIYPKWEKGLIQCIQTLLQQGITSADIEKQLTSGVIFTIENHKMVKPISLLTEFYKKRYHRILIDSFEKERDKDIWGYFTEIGEYIPPKNSELFENLKKEEENRVILHQKNREFDIYFEDSGFLKEEYSFISGIFNEFNSKWIKLKD